METASKTTQKLDVREKLLEAIGEIDRPGNFCTSGDRPLTLPGLEVEGLGAIGLPLGKSEASKLIKLCHQAPYGKGTETLVDTEVRRVWELDPEQFQLTNPKWKECIAAIVNDVKQALGLEKQKLAAHLYKLLVYEEGGFFLPHRDGEKLAGMVATLVVGLPSVHEGGELIVTHDGKRQAIAMVGAAAGQELSYAAFYADCEHEVRPVRSGYRLCLTYNLTLDKSRGKKGVNAPSYRSTAAAIGELLSDWSHHPEAQKLAVTLDHRYTQDGLAIDTLKGIDRARAEVLFDAAECANCVAHLALVTLWQSGSAEGGYEDDSYGRGRRYRRSYDEFDDEDGDEDFDETASDHTMGEVYDQSLSVNHWSDRQGKKVLLGEICFEEDEVVADLPLDDWEASKEEFEGYTGNAGMTLERWYHRAAVVIWPRDKQFQVLCAAGTNASIGGLQVMVKGLKRATKARREAQRSQCIAFAEAIIGAWHNGRKSSWSSAHEKTEPIDRSVCIEILCELDAPDLVRRFISHVMVRDGDVQLEKSFAKFCRRHGWGNFYTDLAAVLDAASTGTLARNLSLLEMLCVERDKDPERITLCGQLCEQAVTALVAFDEKTNKSDWEAYRLDRAKLLVSAINAMLAIDAQKPLRRLIDHALAAADKYDLTAAHLAAIFAMEKQLSKLSAPSAAIAHWLSACRRELQERTARAPQPPADYRRAHELSCKCADCGTLSRFLANPDEKQLRMPLAERRRQHLHQIINSSKCDLTHDTERRGSPYTLVCTKTTASHDAACKLHDRDLKNLSRLLVIQEKSS